MPAAPAQPRQLALETQLGPGALTLVAFTGGEAISQLFDLRLELVAPADAAVPFDQLVGQPVTVGLGGGRRFNGIVSRFAAGGRDQRSASYRAEVVPQLWLLTRRRGSRIFQNQSVPEIVEEVLADAGVDVIFELQGDYPPRNYCVQYRETDFAFVSRLLEDEGIFYFFRNGDGLHGLVVADSPASEQDAGAFRFDERNPSRPDPPRVLSWEKMQELTSGRVTLRDHHFQLPHADLEGTATILPAVQAGQVTHQLSLAGNDAFELYDYPGEYAQRFDGIGPGGGERPQDLQKLLQTPAQVAALRMQEEAARSLAVEGTSTCAAFAAGAAFTLGGHVDGDGAYLLTGVRHSASQRAGATGAGGFSYTNTFTCIASGLPFRPPRTTPIPVVHGPQTAVVVGPAGEEIFTDRYGRVKVQFYWDRVGQQDDSSSCWIRVAQQSSGGAPWVPEVGDEVLVAFMHGDPDRPVIIGSLFNGVDTPPAG